MNKERLLGILIVFFIVSIALYIEPALVLLLIAALLLIQLTIFIWELKVKGVWLLYLVKVPLNLMLNFVLIPLIIGWFTTKRIIQKHETRIREKVE